MDFRGFGFATTWLVHAALAAMIFIPEVTGWSGCTGESEAGPKLGEEQILIEAAIAYKKPEEQKQPQKKRRKKRNKKKITVSRDADKPVDPKKKKKEEEADPSLDDFMRKDLAEEPDNPDLEDGEEAPKSGGSFDGKKYGWADENKGHPYMQEIARWVQFEIPTLEKGKGEAFACIRLSDNGKVSDTKVRKSGNANIDRAAEEALRKLEKKRNSDKDVKPVPSELRDITTHWICFKPTG